MSWSEPSKPVGMQGQLNEQHGRFLPPTMCVEYRRSTVHIYVHVGTHTGPSLAVHSSLVGYRPPHRDHSLVGVQWVCRWCVARPV